MKLIDMLVQELPKRGGWPDGALSITQDNDGSLCVWDTNDPHYDGLSWKHHTGNSLVYYWHGINAVPLSCDHRESIVTYWQYKAALAESQKQAWSGEGLPPAGCECELKYKCHNDDAYWERVIILWKRGDDTLVEYVGDHFKNTTQLIHKTSMHVDFRPLRAEADKKRERICDAIYGALTNAERQRNRSDEAEAVYEAIAAGKIPGVKLDD